MKPGERDEAYLWDGSGPVDPEIAELERKLGVLAYREQALELPEGSARPRAIGARRAGLYVAGGALALAASAALGWFAGRGSPSGGAATETAVVAATTGVASPSIVPSADIAPSAQRRSVEASPCVAADPGHGALRYEVVWGQVSCDGGDAPDIGWLPLETWFETDGSSRVVLEVADLGRVELAPSTRLRILPAKGADSARPGERNEHRLELERGVINARIDAPPRLFIVETRAATAVDLGCAYTLEVGDDGAGLLRVGKGEVALETTSGRASVVHRGEVCETRVGAGAGTPFSVTSTPGFRRALSAWDFEHGALDAVLVAATKDDAAGLLRAIERAGVADRERLVARLDALGFGPKADERAGVLAADKKALDGYRSRLAKAPSPPVAPR